LGESIDGQKQYQEQNELDLKHNYSFKIAVAYFESLAESCRLIEFSMLNKLPLALASGL
jgi:hypothetical protein